MEGSVSRITKAERHETLFEKKSRGLVGIDLLPMVLQITNCDDPFPMHLPPAALGVIDSLPWHLRDSGGSRAKLIATG
ncbi:hypothetical protein CMUS01_10715 [Colletotrichum musicola]|uniref:Uncharacterized protein n=1 Tax=Colletotrichum musicola TaxID=2175873 RepID=A0A8H6K2A6_9PEZI|nr:hypothetical protein CMUS01_10715 [Colletotrichum musicola]